jgi:[CysO sulfur-carrier protein]-S-L-cysteine hydrolase
MVGYNGTVCEVYPITNVAADPSLTFLMERRAQIRVMLEIEARGLNLIGIYHSHPLGTFACPSVTDVAEANYPDAVSLILASAVGGIWNIGAFTMLDGRTTQHALHIV